jgi:hypothetical protein
LKIFDYDYLPLLMIRKFYHTRNKRAKEVCLKLLMVS